MHNDRPSPHRALIHAMVVTAADRNMTGHELKR